MPNATLESTVAQHDAVLSQMTKTLGDIQKEVATNRERSDANFAALTDKLASMGNEIGKPHWQIYLSASGLVLSLIVGGYFVVQLSIANVAGPIKASTQSTEQLAQTNASSLALLSQRLAEEEASRKAAKEKVEATLVEIETQFRAADAFRNVNLANQMRLNSLLWKQSYGTDFPPEIYFPEISSHRR